MYVSTTWKSIHLCSLLHFRKDDEWFSGVWEFRQSERWKDREMHFCHLNAPMMSGRWTWFKRNTTGGKISFWSVSLCVHSWCEMKLIIFYREEQLWVIFLSHLYFCFPLLWVVAKPCKVCVCVYIYYICCVNILYTLAWAFKIVCV